MCSVNSCNTISAINKAHAVYIPVPEEHGFSAPDDTLLKLRYGLETIIFLAVVHELTSISFELRSTVGILIRPVVDVWLFIIRNTISGRFPVNNMIMGICMVLRVRRSSIVPFRHSAPICSNLCFNFCAIFCIADFDFARFPNQPIIFRLGRLPPTTKSTAATFSDAVWCHYIIFLPNCTANFITFQIFFVQLTRRNQKNSSPSAAVFGARGGSRTRTSGVDTRT